MLISLSLVKDMKRACTEQSEFDCLIHVCVSYCKHGASSLHETFST